MKTPVRINELPLLLCAISLKLKSFLFLETGELYTWGWNDYGQLGHGDVISRDLPKLVKNFKDINLYVTNVKCGGWNTAAWTTQSSIK